MKKILSSLKTGILFLLAALCAIACHSCSELGKTFDTTKDQDSSYVAQIIESTVNPSFTSVQDVQEFQSKLVDDVSVDETFRSMPQDVLRNVATVCLRKYSLLTKKDIVLEYENNRAVYDNLPENSTADTASQQSASKNEPTAVEEQQKPASSISYRYEIDTVDGKPVRTLVKEERTHEK